MVHVVRLNYASWVVGWVHVAIKESNSLLFLLAVSSARQEWHICIKHNTHHVSKCFATHLKVSELNRSKQWLVLKLQVKFQECLATYMCTHECQVGMGSCNKQKASPRFVCLALNPLIVDIKSILQIKI